MRAHEARDPSRRRPGTAARRAFRRALTGLLACALPAGELRAQGGPEACAPLEGGLRDACVESALALEAARAGIGLAAAGGADVPGTNSTVGKRLGSAPRIVLALRAGATRAPVADLSRSTWLTSLRGDVAVGLFGGFGAAPTVGGILAIDLLGSAALVSTSEDDGFAGGSVTGPGVGVRLGVFRESFTLPGVTVTATRRWLGETRFGPFGGGQGSASEFETTVTSVRGVVGKEFFAFGFLAGAGWDRYEGDARVQAATSPGGPATTVDADEIASDRTVAFGAVSYNFLVLQLAGEVGWASGFDAPEGRSGGFDPGRSTWFGGVSFRLVL